MGWKEVNQESKNIIQRQVKYLLKLIILDNFLSAQLLWLGGTEGFRWEQ